MGAKQQGADATHGRWLTIPRTLCFVFHGEEILLMKRAPHKRIFPNQYNGLGGHIEANEDPLTGARREILEECGLDVHHLQLRGVHHINTQQNTGILLFVFTAHSDTKILAPTGDEGTLEWLAIDQLGQYALVEDLPLILPRILNMGSNERPYFAYVSYDEQDAIHMQFATE